MKKVPRFVSVALWSVTTIMLGLFQLVVSDNLGAAVQSRTSDDTVTVRGSVTVEGDGAIPGAWLRFSPGDLSPYSKTGHDRS